MLLRGTLNHGLYHLQHADGGHSSVPSITSFSASLNSPVAFVGECTSLQGWHNRLGHPNEKIVRRIVNAFSLPLSSKQ